MATWTLNRNQFLGCLAYSAIFPVSAAIGGGWLVLGMVLTLPFWPLSYIGGMYVASYSGREDAYMVGAYLTIVVQVWLWMTLWVWWRRRR